MRDDRDQIIEGLTDRLEEVLSKFWAGWEKHGKIGYPAVASKKDWGSFQVYLERDGKYKRGQWFRSSQSIGGDVLNLFAYGDRGNHKADAETFRRAREFLGLAEERVETEEERTERLARADRAAKKRADADRLEAQRTVARIKTAAELLDEAVPIKGTHAEAYLLERIGMEPKGGWPDVLKFHPGLPYPSLDGEPDRKLILPVLLCQVTDIADQTIAVWRIFLDPVKPQKASVPNAKLGLGPAGGGAVRIGGTGPVIGVAEGVESALGAWLYVNQRFPVWASLSTSGMAGLQVPLDVDERVWIFPDGDKAAKNAGTKREKEYVMAVPAGRKAANSLVESLGPELARKRPEPPAGKDYCDLWREKLERITYG